MTGLCSSPSTKGGWPLSPTRSRVFPISTTRSRERVPGGTATLTDTSASCCVHTKRSVAPPLPGAVFGGGSESIMSHVKSVA